MKFSSNLAWLAAMPFIAACSGGSGGSGESKIYETNFVDGGTFDEQLARQGVSGYVSNTVDGSIDEVRVRVGDVDGETFYFVSIDGGPEVPLEIVFDDGTFQFLRDKDRNILEIRRGTSGASAQLTWSFSAGDEALFGFTGLQPVELPTGPVTYEGRMLVISSRVADYLQLDSRLILNLDFGTGVLTGSGGGNAAFRAEGNTDPISNVGSISVDVTGTMTGAEMSGTATVTGVASADLTLQGALYGANADTLAGAAGGTGSYNGSDLFLGGSFVADRVD